MSRGNRQEGTESGPVQDGMEKIPFLLKVVDDENAHGRSLSLPRLGTRLGKKRSQLIDRPTHCDDVLRFRGLFQLGSCQTDIGKAVRSGQAFEPVSRGPDEFAIPSLDGVLQALQLLTAMVEEEGTPSRDFFIDECCNARGRVVSWRGGLL